MIETAGLCRTYDGRRILDDIQLNIERGEFVAVLGSNGSGKSTLAKHLNAILIPEKGTVTVDGMNTKNEDKLYDIRERVGMVFQNPDTQAVASIVEDDAAFAPENLGLDADEVTNRVESALEAAGISHLRHRSINTLSGGQKQLTALAGILAMRPEYMVFDEGTSMLDPSSRRRILDCVMKLKRELGIAVIWITHYMDEAALADHVVIIKDGRLAAEGTPQEIFSDSTLIENTGLELPPTARLCIMLKNSGFELDEIPLNAQDCAALIKRLTGGAK